MIVELGHFCLVIACVLAGLQMVLPSVGLFRGNFLLINTGRSLASGVFLFTVLSFCALTYAFLTNDFSVAYVARNSNTLLPWQYQFSAVWGAHEGSFLLWTLVMSTWTLLVANFSKPLSDEFRARVLIVMAGLSVGFYLFLLLTSNPFERTLPFYPSEGADLNPLLQDFGLIVHPPLLYMGYVGLAVPFAFAIASLWSNQLDVSWARWSRPWTNAAWAFLTLGITLGSWWAYYELGWGGWWFWDAVENASFMPWLIATALIHSLAATEKRGVFKSWTVLLAVFGFSFSLLGAFLVRSGILTSVHAFAVDAERGQAILWFITIVIGGSLTLYSLRAWNLKSVVGFDKSGRENFILANNLLLTISAAVILVGTLYPLAYEALNDGAKISVGPPYFNAVFVPLMLPLLVLMAFSQRSQWAATELRVLVYGQGRLLAGSTVLGFGVALLLGALDLWICGIATLAFWLTLNLGMELRRRVKGRQAPWRRLLKQPLAVWSMVIGHFGIAVVALGIVSAVMMSEETDLRMAPGDTATVGDLEVKFLGTEAVQGPNYLSDQGRLEVYRAGQLLAVLQPEKRRYLASQSIMTEADILVRFAGDIYVALGEPLSEGAWAVRIHIKPLVRLIWIGGVLIGLSGFLSLLDRRYRVRSVLREKEISERQGSETAYV